MLRPYIREVRRVLLFALFRENAHQIWKALTMPKLKTRRARVARLKRLFPSENPHKAAAAETKVSRALCHHIASQCLKRGLRAAARWIRAAILPSLPADCNWNRELSHTPCQAYQPHRAGRSFVSS